MKNPDRTVFLKPGREGLLCPFPGSSRRMLAPAGESVTLTTWWRMRIAKGDALISEEPKKPAAKAPKKSTE